MQGVILTSNISQPFPAVQTGIQDSLKHPSFGPKDFRIMITKYIFPQLQLCPISQLLYESSRSSSAILPCTSCWIFYCWACSRFFYLLSMLFALDRHGRLCYNNSGQNFVHTSKWRTVQLRQTIFAKFFLLVNKWINIKNTNTVELGDQLRIVWPTTLSPVLAASISQCSRHCKILCTFEEFEDAWNNDEW